jgi:transglycosylase-like protein with SLT domain
VPWDGHAGPPSLASALLRFRRVTPTINDVRGLPVPGVRAVPQGPIQSPSAARFQMLLEKLRATGSGHPTPPGASRPPTAPSGIRQRRILPHADAGRGPRATSTAHAKRALAASIRHAAAKAGVHPALSVAVARAESSLNPAARSADGKSRGTFQVLPSTAAEMRRKIAAGTVERPPGTDDVALGVGYLRYLHDLFGRDAQLGHGLRTVAVGDPAERERFAVAAFNAGEGSVARAQARAVATGGDPTRFADVRRFLPVGTQGYVERVVSYAREEAVPETVEV